MCNVIIIVLFSSVAERMKPDSVCKGLNGIWHKKKFPRNSHSSYTQVTDEETDRLCTPHVNEDINGQNWENSELLGQMTLSS